MWQSKHWEMYEVCMYEVLLMRLLSTVGTDIYFMHLLSHGNDKLCRLPERQCTDNAYPHLLCHMFVLLEKMLSFVTLKMLAEHTLAVKHLGAPTLSPVKTDLIISPACPHIWMPADLQIKHAVCSGGTSFYLTDTHIDWELIVLLRLQCPLGQWVIEWVGGGQHKHLASPKNKFQNNTDTKTCQNVAISISLLWIRRSCVQCWMVFHLIWFNVSAWLTLSQDSGTWDVPIVFLDYFNLFNKIWIFGVPGSIHMPCNISWYYILIFSPTPTI